MITVHGPYEKDNGRRFVIHYNTETKEKKTQTYPRYLMEQHLGRKLEDWEQVDHINGDPTDDRIENFQLLSAADNTRKYKFAMRIHIFDCIVCGKKAVIPYSSYKNNQLVRKCAGPHCSLKCARVTQFQRSKSK